MAYDQKSNDPLIRGDDDHNIDLLIPKTNLYYYADKDKAVQIHKQGGLLSPELMLKKFPHFKNRIISIYSRYLKNNILKKSVMLFFCRIPEILENTVRYIVNNVPVRVSITKLINSDEMYKLYLVNDPKQLNKITLIKQDQLEDLVTKEDKWYQYFEKSTDPYFRDVPHVAVYCKEGFIPAFACKILDRKEKKK